MLYMIKSHPENSKIYSSRHLTSDCRLTSSLLTRLQVEKLCRHWTPVFKLPHDYAISINYFDCDQFMAQPTLCRWASSWNLGGCSNDVYSTFSANPSNKLRHDLRRYMGNGHACYTTTKLPNVWRASCKAAPLNSPYKRTGLGQAASGIATLCNKTSYDTWLWIMIRPS